MLSFRAFWKLCVLVLDGLEIFLFLVALCFLIDIFISLQVEIVPRIIIDVPLWLNSFMLAGSPFLDYPLLFIICIWILASSMETQFFHVIYICASPLQYPIFFDLNDVLNVSSFNDCADSLELNWYSSLM